MKRRPDSETNFLTWLGVMAALAVVVWVSFGSAEKPDKGWRFDLFSIVRS